MHIKKFSFNNYGESVEFYNQNGFVIFSDLVPKDILNDIINQIESMIFHQYNTVFKSKRNPNKSIDEVLLKLSNKNDKYRERLYKIIQELPSLSQLGCYNRFYKLARDLDIEIPTLRSSQIRSDIPNDDRFLIPPHQEIKGIRSHNTLSFITAINKITKNMGAIQIAPGSFKLGPIIPTIDSNSDYQYVDKKYYEKFPLVQIPLDIGETLMFNMFTIHGSMPNKSKTKIRWSHILRIEDATKMPYLELDDSYNKYNLKEAKY
ncbi:MAG: hypothetical protein CMG74_10525 [Candidatus Marinimicrobia bacterium]|nr:hypothetical protein [Candidatus Neomarinimicrobiota bacterium]|tara:strand:- start:31486 stop:32271 length:786 start_codon:yes stop_codon:yes gene_type:complete